MNTDVKRKPTTKRYSPEEKDLAVRMVTQLRRELGTKQGTVKRVADQLGIGVESLRTWVRQHEIDHGDRAGTTTAEAARIKANVRDRSSHSCGWGVKGSSPSSGDEAEF